MSTLPDGWTAERRPGYGEVHHLTHTRCGWTSKWPVDLVLDRPLMYRVVSGHECADQRRERELHEEIAGLRAELAEHEEASGDELARLTADVVLLARRADSALCVLLIRRGWPPFKGQWALPGGHVDAGEDTAVAAARELLEETELEAPALELVGAYAEPGRDPRGRYVTFAYTATLTGRPPAPVAGDDATEARWWSVAELTPAAVAFDHFRILTDALRRENRS